MSPHFFPRQSDFWKWFEKNNLKEKELIVGFKKLVLISQWMLSKKLRKPSVWKY